MPATYYETYERDGAWYWKVYQYDKTGNREVVLKDGGPFSDEGDAADHCCNWMEEAGVEAELA